MAKDSEPESEGSSNSTVDVQELYAEGDAVDLEPGTDFAVFDGPGEVVCLWEQWKAKTSFDGCGGGRGDIDGVGSYGRREACL